MHQIAIECSGIHGSVALTRDRELLELAGLTGQQSSVQSLAPALSKLLSRHSVRPDCISITSGPGSFTGLRVGLATAKMLGLAWNIPIVPVDTLEVLAHQMTYRVPHVQSTILIPVMNAYRQQVFTAAWRFVRPDPIMRLSPTQFAHSEAWRSEPLGCQNLLQAADVNAPVVAQKGREETGQLTIAGPGLEKYRPHSVLDPGQRACLLLEDIQPMADAVAELGLRYFGLNQYCCAENLSANYVRSSAAEEKLAR